MDVNRDKALIDRVLAKDQAAFDEFFNAYFGRLVRFCQRRIAAHGAAQSAVEDIVQETMLKALRSLHNYRGEALLFTWLCMICRNEISNWHRKNGGKAELTDSIDSNLGTRAAVESLAVLVRDESDKIGLAEIVQLTLDYLPDNYGRVLEMKYVDGYSVGEIAARLGTGKLATQSLLARARTAFRSVFAELEMEAGG